MPARRLTLLAPGRLDAPTGGDLYNRRMLEALGAAGWSVTFASLASSFPFPTADARRHARGILHGLGDGAIVLIDSLAFGVMPDEIEHHRGRLRVVGLIHLPLAADPCRDGAAAADLRPQEARAFGAASGIVVTGPGAVPLIAPYAVEPHRVAVVEPGTDLASPARGSGSATVELLSVATINRGKGHDGLLHALGGVDGRWRLTCVGSLTRDHTTAERIRRLAEELDMTGRVRLVGELEPTAVAGCYDRADVFVLATMQETYGMAVAEALAHGLPVVATRTGAIPALVGEDAGLLVEAGDRAALQDALARVISDERLRSRLAAGARSARARLHTWDQAAATMTRALDAFAAHG